jgi:alkanesulfonate monooxygenase SsuD/methylene tetrahydromethanopterin reductase-like flavin-dependent oxidoreductase (luciferase family)
MNDRRMLHLNAFLMSTGHHEASWRLPESDPYANTDVRHFQRLAQTAERGRLDSIFFADSRCCGAMSAADRRGRWSPRCC